MTLQTHVASGEVAKRPPVDKLCNINIDKVVERCFSCFFSAIINANTELFADKQKANILALLNQWGSTHLFAIRYKCLILKGKRVFFKSAVVFSGFSTYHMTPRT